MEESAWETRRSTAKMMDTATLTQMEGAGEPRHIVASEPAGSAMTISAASLVARPIPC
ncbi:MAG: hypothetical protein IBX67_08205 [Dehalococcoidia bacterium]|nr:hypothetical protein [Dehalococcoidia bacterium]